MSSMKIAAETTAAVPRMVRKDMWQWNSVVERAAVGEQPQLPRAMPRPRPRAPPGGAAELQTAVCAGLTPVGPR